VAPAGAASPVPYPLPKRLTDRAIAGGLLVLLAPLVLGAAAASAAGAAFSPRDRGPLLYREPRISRGRRFELLKFRTLRADVLRGAAAHARLLERDPQNLTWAGRRVLKPWYLDELPQLLNVLRGDISLVGPRPWPPELVEAQVAEGRDYRNRIVAGLTGPAQVTKASRGPVRRPRPRVRGGVPHAARLGPRPARPRHPRRTLAVLARGEGLNY
jgi:lipopolysaccharide/colanic/teichoic acid biosynthesis glycosyltransferase